MILDSLVSFHSQGNDREVYSILSLPNRLVIQYSFPCYPAYARFACYLPLTLLKAGYLFPNLMAQNYRTWCSLHPARFCLFSKNVTVFSGSMDKITCPCQLKVSGTVTFSGLSLVRHVHFWQYRQYAQRCARNNPSRTSAKDADVNVPRRDITQEIRSGSSGNRPRWRK